MAGTTFVDKSTIIQASWLQMLNDFYFGLFQGAITAQQARDAIGIGTPQTTVTELAGTTYTLANSDISSILVATNSSGCAITIPSNSDVDIATGSTIVIVQQGVGQVVVTGDGGVTVFCAGTASTRAQSSVIGLAKTDADTWYLTGDYTTT